MDEKLQEAIDSLNSKQMQLVLKKLKNESFRYSPTVMTDQYMHNYSIPDWDVIVQILDSLNRRIEKLELG